MNELEMKKKTAAFADAAKQLGGATGQALGAAAAAGTVAMVGVAASKLYDAATKARDYRAMLAANPEVHEFARESPNMANSMFTSLRQLNPAYSKDPFVAGHFMRQMANDPHGAGGYLMLAAHDHDPNKASPLLETYLKGAVEGTKPRSSNTLPWGTPPGGVDRSPPDPDWKQPTGWEPPPPKGPGPGWRPNQAPPARRGQGGPSSIP